MTSIRKLHGQADWARKKAEAEATARLTGAWDGWPGFYDATQELRRAATAYEMKMSKANYDRLIAAALDAHATDTET